MPALSATIASGWPASVAATIGEASTFPRMGCRHFRVPSAHAKASTALPREPTITRSPAIAALERYDWPLTADRPRQATSALRKSIAKKPPPSVPKNTLSPLVAGVVPVGPSIGTAAFSSPLCTSITCSFPSQPAKKTRSPSAERATVGEQRIWSAIECFQSSLPSASCRHDSDASCEPTSTRPPSAPARIVGPPEISPSVSYSQMTLPVRRSKARTMPVSSPTTTNCCAGMSDTAAADENPAASALNVHFVAPEARSNAWNVPSRSPRKIMSPAITGTAPKAVFSRPRCHFSISGRRSVVADRPVPDGQPRAIGQASAGAASSAATAP